MWARSWSSDCRASLTRVTPVYCNWSVPGSNKNKRAAKPLTANEVAAGLWAALHLRWQLSLPSLGALGRIDAGSQRFCHQKPKRGLDPTLVGVRLLVAGPRSHSWRTPHTHTRLGSWPSTPFGHLPVDTGSDSGRDKGQQRAMRTCLPSPPGDVPLSSTRPGLGALSTFCGLPACGSSTGQTSCGANSVASEAFRAATGLLDGPQLSE